MQIVTHRREMGGWTVLSVAGDLDVAGGPELRSEIVSAVAAGAVDLVLDLTGVDFVDSFGLGVVVGALKRTRQRGGDLVLVCPEARIRRVFELCDLDRVLPIHDSLDQVSRRSEGER